MAKLLKVLSVFGLAALAPTATAATLGTSATEPAKPAALLRTEPLARPIPEQEIPEHFLDVRHKDGKTLRERGGKSWVHKFEDHPQLGSLVVTTIKEDKQDEEACETAGSCQNCPYLVSRVLQSIKFHLGMRTKASFVSEPEAQLFANLKEGENGRDVLSNTMRVLGNYTLAEGIMAGSLWTIDNQNHYISCEQNIKNRLEEHTTNELGDALLQGDMATTSTLCRYSEQSSKVSNMAFPVGTRNCLGVSGCQFAHPDEAVHFCNTEPECTLIMGKADETGCEGGLGCYMPKKGAVEEDDTWSTGGGKTYVKHCPGSFLDVTDAAKRLGTRDAGLRWKNGEVAYCFSAEVTPEVMEAFHIAVENVKRQVPCLTFNLANRINDTRCDAMPSIIVQSKRSGCWSYVGQVSGNEKAWKSRSQPLNLDRGCEMVGTALHQLGHALGMVHENSRADRASVMEFNESNVQEGKSKEFGMSQDVQKYAWSGYDTCAGTKFRTRTTMTKTDCLKVEGYFDEGGAPSPPVAASPAAASLAANASATGGDTNATDADAEVEPADAELIECQMDLCEDGKYFPAPTNKCGDKVASMAIKMERKDCTRAMGTPQGGENPWDWTSCHFDLCTDMGLHLARPFACANKLAYGYIETPHNHCDSMGGSVSVQHAGMDWANCYFDFCSGEFDAPFDFLSLMMYSPYAWSKTGKDMTLKPLGNHSAMLSSIMGQRMGFSGMDVFHLGHMYNCWDRIKPDFESKNLSHRIASGEFFEFSGTCEDAAPENTGFDVHGELGYMKHASCADMSVHCRNESIGAQVRDKCPVSCFVCMPHHGTIGGAQHEGGACFDAISTGIRFKDGPKATCKDLVRYCNHTVIGPQVTESCKLSCGLCEPHIYAPFYDTMGHCNNKETKDDPQFTVGGEAAACDELSSFCQDHADSYLVRHKCPKTCGLCGGDEEAKKAQKPPETNEIYIPGDPGNCDRRRRFGFCSTRRRRNI